MSDHIRSSTYSISKPVNFEKMKRFAIILSKDIPFASIDFTKLIAVLYLGEITFSQLMDLVCSGLMSGIE